MDDASKSLDLPSMQEKLYSAVIADCLDELGFREQAMDHRIRPIEPSFVLAGRACTMLAEDARGISEDPYEKELEAVGALAEGDVMVAAVNSSENGALWGELLSTAASSRGAGGAVIDGFARDSARISQMGFPTFVRGYSPLDSKGRIEVVAHGVPIRCGGVEVNPGDVVFGDRDGVVVVPGEVADEALLKAAGKASGENDMREALRRGVGVVEAYRQYGIL